MHVLVVDDSRSMRMLIRRCMRQAGYGAAVVSEAGDGAEGLQKLQEIQPDLILSDWNMPGVGGEEFARNVKASYPNAVIGFITSEASAEINERAMATGAQFLVTKPFDADSIAAAFAPYLGAA